MRVTYYAYSRIDAEHSGTQRSQLLLEMSTEWLQIGNRQVVDCLSHAGVQRGSKAKHRRGRAFLPHACSVLHPHMPLTNSADSGNFNRISDRTDWSCQ